MPARHLIPLVDWPLHHSWPPLGGLRHLVRHRLANGFDVVLRRVGRRLLIDEAAFFAWADRRDKLALAAEPTGEKRDTG